MKNIILGNGWIRLDQDRVQISAIARYQVSANELKLYLLSGEIFKIVLQSEEAKNTVLGALDHMCSLALPS